MIFPMPLFGLYPGTIITKENTLLTKATINTLNRRLQAKGDREGLIHRFSNSYQLYQQIFQQI